MENKQHYCIEQLIYYHISPAAGWGYTDNYTNILTVTGDYHTQIISCEVDFVSRPFYNDELKPLTITGLVKYIQWLLPYIQY